MSKLTYAFGLSKYEVNEMMPPGTSHLIDTQLVRTETQHHTIEEKHIHLVPEPSADPGDPLNWPIALPDLVTAFATFDTSGNAAGIESFSNLTHLIAVNSFMLGASAVWWVPLSNTFGRRPIILINLLVMCLGSVWCGKAKSYNSLLAARIIQGCGGGAADAINSAVIGEIFFVHQRGRAMAVYTVCLVIGAPLGGLVGGYITASLGWRWTIDTLRASEISGKSA
ncbi:hypothetical protein SEUCBS140593_004537 [Sporothrix eucalyptigena]|uniref:Major facilitator superfamily (MFS) profile domain-containing protein n=1 Tax=Sporothrix eucalyptigena TaxID=1812306 RepID=A0ABP0BNW6_9PEZI